MTEIDSESLAREREDRERRENDRELDAFEGAVDAGPLIVAVGKPRGMASSGPMEPPSDRSWTRFRPNPDENGPPEPGPEGRAGTPCGT